MQQYVVVASEHSKQICPQGMQAMALLLGDRMEPPLSLICTQPFAWLFDWCLPI